MDINNEQELMKKNNFTLIELLIVTAIVGILISMLLPSLSNARYKANLAVCLSNMKQCHIGVYLYSNNNSGKVPFVSAIDQPDCYYNENQGILLLKEYLSGFGSWKCAILPSIKDIDDSLNTAIKGRSSFGYYPGRIYMGEYNTPIRVALQEPQNIVMQDLWYYWGGGYRTNHSNGGTFKTPYSNNQSFGTYFDGTAKSVNAVWVDGHGKTYKAKFGIVFGSSISNSYYGIAKP